MNIPQGGMSPFNKFYHQNNVNHAQQQGGQANPFHAQNTQQAQPVQHDFHA